MILQMLNKEVVVIDRTLPEIYAAKKMSRLDILDFCWLLRQVGVDIIEVDARLMRSLGKLPEGLEFMLEAESAEDLPICTKLKNRRCVLQQQLLAQHEAVEYIRIHSLYAVLEVPADSLEDLYGLDRLLSLPGLDVISCIRITSLEKLDSHLWIETVELLKGILGKRIDICPYHSLSMGNAILLEAAANGMDYVTSTFMGHGGERGYASTEILLTALKVFYGDTRNSDLKMLPQLRALFTKYSHVKVPANIPVIGRNIFMYEAGIHAGGICSNPNTYEPYDPEIVGQKRELVIGKHSGRLSIVTKLAELGMDVEKTNLLQLLQRVRDLSVRMNRSLSDEEFVHVYSQSSMH